MNDTFGLSETSFGGQVVVRRSVAIFALWTIAGIVFSGQTYLYFSNEGVLVPWDLPLRCSLIQAYTWASLTPLVCWIANRLRKPGQALWRVVALNLPFAICVGVASILVETTLHVAFETFERAPSYFVGTFEALLELKLPSSILCYMIIVAVYHGLGYRQDAAEREAKESRLVAQLSEARLESLRSKLQPHFLFNSLQAVATLMRRDVEVADDVLGDVSDLLRMSLARDAHREITLGEELSYVRTYLKVEKARMGDRLQFQQRVEKHVSSAMVPPLLLQPLVENAIRHGLSRSRSGGVVTVGAEELNGRLRLEVSDTGVGMRTAECKPGFGLEATEERVRELYRGDYLFDVRSVPGRGTRVALVIPLRFDREERGRDA